ncbi:MAG: uroporphyrinogen decarboxylase [Alphaproteobacteria bacterium]|nr:uroporphyrinogen decarboxylase [Alphaproteobacteria bacterium]
MEENCEKENTKTLLECLKGRRGNAVPFWLMRQAGRYLPEYRKLRSSTGGFLDLVYDPKKAAEVTMQPIRRFGMNGAILFSDILVIPHALGQPVTFEAGEGPKLSPILIAEDFKKLNVERIDRTLEPIYETVSNVVHGLKAEGFDDTAMIGFAGSPWTVACYMIEGGGSKVFEATKYWAYRHPESFSELINIISGATLHYLSRQIEAGAEAIQIFDSWSGILNSENFARWVIEPTKSIVDALKKRHPDIPVIGFAREAGVKLEDYALGSGVDAIGIDYSMPPEWVRDHIQIHKPVQGNLDPVALLAGGDTLKKSATHILEVFSTGKNPFIFNLGHGVIKDTAPECVEELCEIIREFKA